MVRRCRHPMFKGRHCDAGLEHHGGEIAVGQLVAHAPAHAQDDDLVVEVAALEHRMAATTNHTDLRRGGLTSLPGCRCNITFPNAVRTEVLGINSQGEIVGDYTDAANRIHGFVARPVPEPSTFSLLAGVLVVAVTLGRLSRFLAHERVNALHL
jgi:hypothetical protein